MGFSLIPRRRTDDRIAAGARLALLICVLLHGAAVQAQEALSCGTQLQRHLLAGAQHTYVLAQGSDAVVVVSVVDRSPSPSLLRIKGEGGLETCSGAMTMAASPGSTIEISDCIGNDEIDYTISSNVVSGGSANCARPLPCGLVPRVREWKVAGAVTAYSFQAVAGQRVTLRATDIDGTPGTVRIQVFNPEGAEVNRAGSCGGEVRFDPRLSGLYTVLVNPCVEALTPEYRIGYRGPHCPAGPEITYLGIARSDSTVVAPFAYDDEGRPIYTRVGGAGFSIVVEAMPGADEAAPGLIAFEHDASNPATLPDLQVLLSQPLGNGNAEVCAEDPDARDGIPATEPLAFTSTRVVADAINDFGCRVNDGTGRALGVNLSVDACTIFSDGSSHFVDPASTTQFCAPIPGVRQFSSGDTIVAARVRDVEGMIGPVREMIVRVEAVPTSSPTPSRTPTVPTSPTPTRTAIACVGDCNDDSVVALSEIVGNLTTALAGTTATCAAIDADGGGTASVDELVLAVRHAVDGCAP